MIFPMIRSVTILSIVATTLVAACSRDSGLGAPASAKASAGKRDSGLGTRDSTPDSRLPNPERRVPDPESRVPRIVILGDSLTAGLGLAKEESFPSLLQDHLKAEGHPYEVVNAGVSGDTSAGGLRRLDWALEGNVHILIVELGANDGLRGLPVEGMKRNLSEIITRAQTRGVTVILTGMEAPPNYGAAYTAAFREAFRDLAGQHNVAFVPFLLEGVAGLRDLNSPDGIHPNPAGARIVERTVWKALEPLLDQRDR
jgi:acyl-CoA thioesterase-1